MMNPIYLDYAATTPVDPRVAAKMSAALTLEGNFANPASKSHRYGWEAAEAVDIGRSQVAALCGADSREIVFTSGATESDNLAIIGVAEALAKSSPRRHIITSMLEHKAILDPCHYLESKGYKVTYLQPGSDGIITKEMLADAIDEDTLLVSLMHANNEIGVIQDIGELAKVAHEAGALFHSDCAQSAGKVKIDVTTMPVDYLSFSAHKVYGPKGIGAAFMKSDAYGIAPITALMHGGEQEFGFRAGTHAVHNIVGFGKAAEIALRDLKKNEVHIKRLDEMLLKGIATIDNIHTTVDSSKRVPGIISLVVDKSDFHNERFIKKISNEVALSTGSACSAGEPSYVIQALGLGEKVNKVLRVSINKYTTKDDITSFLELLRSI